MNKHRNRIIAVAGLVGLCLLVLLFTISGKPLVRLEIAARTIERDRPVVHFKITGTQKGLMQIEGVYLIDVGHEQARLVHGTNGLYGCLADIGPGMIDPIDDTNRQKPEFGIIEPTNKVWRLKTELIMEDRSLFRRLSIMLGAWKAIGKGNGLSALRTLKNVHAFKLQHIISEPVTNAVAPEVSSTM